MARPWDAFPHESSRGLQEREGRRPAFAVNGERAVAFDRERKFG